MEIFYLKGDPTYLPTLKDDDTIMVPGNPVLTTVKVVGSVKSPGSYEVAFRTGLLDVLFMAGGPTDEANLNRVKLISLPGQTQREIKINFDDFLKNIIAGYGYHGCALCLRKTDAKTNRGSE